MQLVLWPKHLFGGLLARDGGLGAAESGQGGLGSYNEVAQGLRGIAGRVTDADALLSGTVNEQLRDWDLWGPLVFSLLLSLLLSLTARREQSENVFTGVFSLVWIGSAVVTWQIRLLGGKMYVEVVRGCGRVVANRITEPSFRPFVSSATHFSQLSLQPYSAHLGSNGSFASRYILHSCYGLWQRA